MLTFSFLNFHEQYFGDFYTGNNEFKRALWRQISLVIKGNQGTSFFNLCEEADKLIQQCFNKNEKQAGSLQSFAWNTDKDENLRNSFSKGSGDSHKAIAIQYLILSTEKYKNAAKSEIPLELSDEALNECFVESELDNAGKNSTIEQTEASNEDQSNQDANLNSDETSQTAISCEPDERQVRCLECNTSKTQTLDPNCWTFGLNDDKQYPALSGSLGIFLHIHMKLAHWAGGLSYGFKNVRVKVTNAPNIGKVLRYSSEYAKSVDVADNVTAITRAPDDDRYLEISSSQFPLNIDKQIVNGPVLTIGACDGDYQFETSLMVETSDLNMVKSDGQPLSLSENKLEVLKWLLCASEDKNLPFKNGVLTLSKKTFTATAISMADALP